MIRPYAVLQQTLVELKKRWRAKISYDWICNQLKSLRQDLTVWFPFQDQSFLDMYFFYQVQRIKNEFTVQVYEMHARVALESVRSPVSET